MAPDEFLARQMGDEPPLLADGRKQPDRREISLRWLSGTFMTAITSSLLMGIALFGALEGREQLAIPAEALASTDEMAGIETGPVEKGARLIPSVVIAKTSDREIMEVSTMVRDGDLEVVRKQPFVHLKMALAAPHSTSKPYPRFDPLNIFATGDAEAVTSAQTGQIYGAEVDSEISLRTIDFPLESPNRAYATSMTLDEAEETVRTNGSVLTDGATQLATLYYVDPRRFGSNMFDLDFSASLNARVIAENVSIASYDPDSRSRAPEFVDDIVPVRQQANLAGILEGAGYIKEQYEVAANALGKMVDISALPGKTVIRIGIMQSEFATRIVRLSVYELDNHIATVAITDQGFFKAAAEPQMTPAIESAFKDNPLPVAIPRELPNVYDGIYRAGLSYGMSLDMIGQIVRLLASDVDFQSELQPSDSLEAFFSVTDESGKATEDSELIFVRASFGSRTIRLYRFQHPQDNSIDYYDKDGHSARVFLLRNPVPNGRFRSSFGMRKHPILGYKRMHSGVDWAAPRGTPIIAAGDGTVISAGWNSGGYGKQTMIRHANGYVSSYNHQSAIAKGVKPGATVRQGQVIGRVGSTGLSTGNHLHYELIVNGTKVDPMRVRLPDSKTLEGKAMARFQRERKRIDALLDIKPDETKVASK